MAIVEFNGYSYHVDDKLMKLWKKYSLEYLKKKNADRFYIVDGRERAGKSTWAIQQGCALDSSLKDINVFLSRVCFTPEEFDKACQEVKNGVIWFDEAFRGFSSRAALSKINRKLIQTLMEMGQNNNIVFLILPSFFMLDVYPAMLRSNALFNIYLDKKTGTRCWRGYNEKDKNRMYQKGIRQGWQYLFDSKFKGRFWDNEEHTKFPGGKLFYDAYIAKKAKAFRNIKQEVFGLKEETPEQYELTGEEKIISSMYDKLKSIRKLRTWLIDQERTISVASLHKLLVQIKEKRAKLSLFGVQEYNINMIKSKEKKVDNQEEAEEESVNEL